MALRAGGSGEDPRFESGRAHQVSFCWACKQKGLLHINMWDIDSEAAHHAKRTRHMETRRRRLPSTSWKGFHVRRVWKNIPKTNLGDTLNQRPNSKVLCMSTMYDQGSKFQSVSEREGWKRYNFEREIWEADGRTGGRCEVWAFLWVFKQASEEHAFSRRVLNMCENGWMYNPLNATAMHSTWSSKNTYLERAFMLPIVAHNDFVEFSTRAPKL